MDELDNIMKRDYTFGTKPKEIASDLYMPIATRHLASARRFIEFIPEHAVSPDILIELLKIYKDPPPTIKLPEPEGKRPIPIPTQELDISKYLVLASKALVERIGPEGLTPEKGSHIIHLAKEVNLKKHFENIVGCQLNPHIYTNLHVMSDSPDTPKPDLSIVKERPSTIALKAFRKPAETVGEIRESMLTTPTHTIGTIERK